MVLDREQLKDITMNDADLMREIVTALVDDTSRQMGLLEAAIRDKNRDACVRLAHYAKGASANVGAVRLAGLLRQIELEAALGEFKTCSDLLLTLAQELDQLRLETATL
jgi:HPt (histidine-containing phosphotransfer) domain-containing protein